MPQINLLAVLVCGISSMVLGGLWYSPMLFGKRWQAETGLTDERLAAGNMAIIYGVAFLLSLIAAFVFGMFLGQQMPLAGTVGAGFAAGLCWVAAAFGINYLFERKSRSHWLINGGYHTIQFTLFGLILGFMR